MSRPTVVVSSVTHKAGRTTVLDDISFDADEARLIVLSGRSGSGKTTLLHLMAGVVAPSHGSVTVLDRPATDLHDWSLVSLTPQHSTVAGSMSVRENVLLPAALRSTEVDEELLADLALDAIADQPATGTSLGEQQRTGIARGLLLQPRVALLDEPTSHQDDENVERVLSVLLRARSGGTTLVVATHDARVAAVADVVHHLVGGRLV
jgi:ABC-type multidrug transport system ATPase subunit